MNKDAGFYNIDLIKDLIVYNQEKFNAHIYGTYFDINPEYEKLLNARYHKVSRIRERLVFLCSHYKYIWFCTFTFNNNYINKNFRLKRDLVKNVLKNNDFKYILNIDYGKQSEREHYHCIIGTNCDIDINEFFQSQYKGGFSLSIPCKKGTDDIKRLCKYINKLVNHCIKATTNKQRLVYNFKGYDEICPDSYTKRIVYLKDYYRLNYGIDNDFDLC